MPITIRTYSQSEVNKIFSHIPPRTIRSWALILPLDKDLIKTTRLGKHRRYTLANLYLLALIDELSSWGFPLDYIRAVMMHFQEFPSEYKHDILIVSKLSNDIQAFTWKFEDFYEYSLINFHKKFLKSGDFKASLKEVTHGSEDFYNNIDKKYIESKELDASLQLGLFCAPKLLPSKEEIEYYSEKDTDEIIDKMTSIIIDLRL